MVEITLLYDVSLQIFKLFKLNSDHYYIILVYLLPPKYIFNL
jgi:hypothetical protein